MRTDLVTAVLIHEWLTKHMPELVESWHLEVDEQVERMVQVVKSTLDGVHSILVAQNLIAKLVIDEWGFHDMAVLAGGTPTPLSPKPEDIRYWTDTNPIVVAEAASAGYNALHVDVMNVEHLKMLQGVSVVVATGLLHFMPDAAVALPFKGLAEAGISTFIFTQGNLNVGAEFSATVVEYKKLGVDLFLRSPEQVQQIIPPDWHVEQVSTAPEALKKLSFMDGHISSMPQWIDVYKVIRS